MIFSVSTDIADTRVGLVLIYTAFNVPFAAFLMQGVFDGLPVELEEAALIDGCRRFTALIQRHLVGGLTAGATKG